MKTLTAFYLTLWIVFMLFSSSSCSFEEPESATNIYVTTYETGGITTINGSTSTNFTQIIGGNGTHCREIIKPSGYVVGTSASQNMTNKILHSPEFSGSPDFNGATLIMDADGNSDITFGDADNRMDITLDGYLSYQMDRGAWRGYYLWDNTYSNYYANYKRRIAGDGLVWDNDRVGSFIYYAWDGDEYIIGARIDSYIDGSPDDDDMPTRIEFRTTPDGSDTNQVALMVNQDMSINMYNFLELVEVTAPDAGGADTVRIYPVVSGGKTDLCAKFQDGTVDIFAQETTPLDAPIFTYASGTVGKLVLKKPHAGLVIIVMEFPDGTIFEVKRIEYHLESKILANKGCDGELPLDWYIETDEEMQERLNPILASENTSGGG